MIIARIFEPGSQRLSFFFSGNAESMKCEVLREKYDVHGNQALSQ